MRVLLHCCCGPCTTGVVEAFTARGEAVEGWYHSPNIAPGEEWERRREAFHQAAEALGLPTRGEGEAPRLADFLLALARGGGRRCRACYRLRLEAVARVAAAEGYEAFSTTLAISPYQDLAALAEVGREVGEEQGVSFAFLDLRANYPKSRARSRELGLYLQNYCGCLFSRLERAVRRSEKAVWSGRDSSREQRRDNGNDLNAETRSAQRGAESFGFGTEEAQR